MPDDQLDHDLAAQDYIDLAANWAITEKATVTFGINNILDNDPSVSGAVGTTGNGNTYPQTLRRPRSLRLRAGHVDF